MDKDKLYQIVEPLLVWYGINARELPWRMRPEPYRVWVSEIMLQQTRVEAVKPYYERFLSALPGVEDLAKAPEDRLLKLWEGLGYYSRVRNMQRAARMIMERYDGSIPGTFAELKALPGIGAYTAGAIASIAFGERVPLVDGNVLRVVSRLTASREDIAKPAVKRWMAEGLAPIVPAERPGDFNQALMELGATVCLPNGEPLCACCPLFALCKSRQMGIVHEIPVKSKKTPRRVEEMTVLIMRDADGRISLKKRRSGSLLAGMWGYPVLAGKMNADEVEAYLKDGGINAESILPLGEAKHIFTHVEWIMTGYDVRIGIGKPGFAGCIWVTEEERRERYAIASAFQHFTVE